MPITAPFAAIEKIFDAGGTAARPNARDAGAAAELRKLLSRPIAPLAKLSVSQRRRLAGGNLAKLAAAFDEVRPSWMPEYAAAAAVGLPAGEDLLRDFMLQVLFEKENDAAHALAMLAGELGKADARGRKGRLAALLRGLGRLPALRTAIAPAALQGAFAALTAKVKAPATPEAFAQLAFEVSLALRAFMPGAALVPHDDASSPVEAIRPCFDDVHRRFLARPGWGTFGEEISAALWQALWARLPSAAAPPPMRAEKLAHSQKALLKEAAWADADQAIGRALQDSGRLVRALDKLEAAARGEAADRAASVRGASNLLLQWVRQAAQLRDIEADGAFGAHTEFDPVLHESDDAVPGEPVRVLKPAILRSGGAQRTVLLRGEVEPD